MDRNRCKKVLLVAPETYPRQLTNDFKDIKHVTNINLVFPTIFESKPEVIILDFDFTGSDLEKIIRRIKFNKYYQNLKICCYKTSSHTKIDSLLKALGVDQIIYQEDLVEIPKNKSITSYLGTILSGTFLKRIASASN